MRLTIFIGKFWAVELKFIFIFYQLIVEGSRDFFIIFFIINKNYILLQKNCVYLFLNFLIISSRLRNNNLNGINPPNSVCQDFDVFGKIKPRRCKSVTIIPRNTSLSRFSLFPLYSEPENFPIARNLSKYT